MPDPRLEPNDKEQQPVLGEGPWNDKVLVDAIGYTKGLVAILDSLTDGFQRRGGRSRSSATASPSCRANGARSRRGAPSSKRRSVR